MSEFDRFIGQFETEIRHLKGEIAELKQWRTKHEEEALEQAKEQARTSAVAEVTAEHQLATAHGLKMVHSRKRQDSDDAVESKASKTWKNRLALAKQIITSLALAAVALGAIYSVAKQMQDGGKIDKKEMVRLLKEAQKEMKEAKEKVDKSTGVELLPEDVNPPKEDNQ